MAKSKINYNQKEPTELKKILKETGNQLLEARTELAQGKAKDTHRCLKLRREIARIKTALRAKMLGG